MTHKVFKVFILALATLGTSNMYSDARLGSKVWRFTHSVPKRHSVPTKQEEERRKRKGVMDKMLFQIQVQLLCHSEQLLFHPH